MRQIYLTTRAAWRQWLAKNHQRETGIWLVFYKKHTQMPTLEYDEVVEEALCFGWIDSIIKKSTMTDMHENSRHENRTVNGQNETRIGPFGS